jgi:hypothetical protein
VSKEIKDKQEVEQTIVVKNYTDIPEFNENHLEFIKIVGKVDIFVEEKIKEYKLQQKNNITDLCKYYDVFIGKEINVYSSINFVEEKTLENPVGRFTEEAYDTTYKILDYQVIEDEMKKSNAIGKYAKIYSSSTYGEASKVVISGWQLASAKTVKTRIITRCIADWINRDKRSNNVPARKVSCKFVELFMQNSYDAETLRKLILNECSV